MNSLTPDLKSRGHAGLPLKDLHHLIALAQIQEIPASTVLLLEGTLPRTIYILLTGKCRIHAKGRRSRPISSPGTVIWSDDPAQYSCSMHSPGAVLAIDVREARAAGVLEELRRQATHLSEQNIDQSDRLPHDLVVISQVLNGSAFKTALDLGCGGGRLSPLLTACARHTVLLDINRSALNVASALAGGSASAVCAQFDAIPFPTATFSLVASRLALHESKSHDAAIEEIRRVLRRKGTLLIADVVPPAGGEAASLFDELEAVLDPAYRRPPSRSQWTTLLHKHGFGIELATPTRVRRELTDRPFGEGKREICIQSIHRFSKRAHSELGVRQSVHRLEWTDRRLVLVARAM